MIIRMNIYLFLYSCLLSPTNDITAWIIIIFNFGDIANNLFIIWNLTYLFYFRRPHLKVWLRFIEIGHDLVIYQHWLFWSLGDLLLFRLF